MTQPIKAVESVYRKWSNSKPLSIEPLPESGSYRTYYRILSSQGTILGVHNADKRENQAFIYLSSHLKRTGNSVPEVLYADLENNVYIEQDLGNITMFEHLAGIRKKSCTDEDIINLYKNVIDAMPGLQVSAASDLDYTQCYPRAEFDVQSMMWDMNYFKYCLLKPLKIDFFEQDLEDDFVKIVKWLIDAERSSFMFRDFQSRNIMIANDSMYFIDFQGGRKGPLQYDLASLLFEAKTRLSEDIRNTLLNYYLDVFSKRFSWFNAEQFVEFYYGFVYLRLMQAMGAYGFRGYIERKPLFLQSLPYAVNTLKWLIEKHPIPLKLASLQGVFERLIAMPQVNLPEISKDTLTITINSFSYKNGIPQDHSGNGGGFVFDCRSLDNPGRYEEYKEFNGKDKPVIDFLESKTETGEFIGHIFPLIFNAVENYTKRGFTHLMVSFGCTGGQHRSVYFAERLAAELKVKTKANIVVVHNELGKKSTNK
ncbi:MAG TPA: RNase adapter RapZ [Bacteroidales bacterium]|jgi:aminoglycoside/choline kinase family phosphotransferase|nr:RNase adapter RapZ [Bacteroidales bacterium]